MKNIILCLFVIAACGIFSCKKTYTCQCSYDATGGLVTPAPTVEALTIPNAVAKCMAIIDTGNTKSITCGYLGN